MSGKLAGLATLRDDATVTYQSQLDEIARGLIETFAESDQIGRGAARYSRPLHLSRRAGDARRPALISAGLAGTIFVDPSVDQSVGRQSEIAEGRRDLRQPGV